MAIKEIPVSSRLRPPPNVGDSRIAPTTAQKRFLKLCLGFPLSVVRPGIKGGERSLFLGDSASHSHYPIPPHSFPSPHSATPRRPFFSFPHPSPPRGSHIGRRSMGKSKRRVPFVRRLEPAKPFRSKKGRKGGNNGGGSFGESRRKAQGRERRGLSSFWKIYSFLFFYFWATYRTGLSIPGPLGRTADGKGWKKFHDRANFGRRWDID